MTKLAWSPAITIEDRSRGTRRTVRTPGQARIALHRDWPDMSGSRYRIAEAICEAALRGQTDPAEARKAFIAAAIEAHLNLS